RPARGRRGRVADAAAAGVRQEDVLGQRLSAIVPSIAGMDWNDLLIEQADFHWRNQLRPRLEGLTDDEYRWEPVPGAWNVRPRGEAVTRMAAGGGDLVVDWEWPEPVPPPVTTIAWRFAHIIVGVFGTRNASHFGGPPADYLTWQ